MWRVCLVGDIFTIPKRTYCLSLWRPFPSLLEKNSLHVALGIAYERRPSLTSDVAKFTPRLRAVYSLYSWVYLYDKRRRVQLCSCYQHEAKCINDTFTGELWLSTIIPFCTIPLHAEALFRCGARLAQVDGSNSLLACIVWRRWLLSLFYKSYVLEYTEPATISTY